MNEKVLGFYKKKGYYDDSESFMKELKDGQSVQMNGYLIREDNIVSVRLASKSVDLKWLERFCKEHEVKTGYGMMPFIHSFDLIKKAKKEAKR